MVERLLAILAAVVLAAQAFAVVFGADNKENPPRESLDRIVEEAIVIEAAAQEKLDAWNEERDALLEEARTMKFELQWLELQQKKLSRYVESNRKKIDALEEENSRYAVISLQLENFLLQDLDRFEQSVAESPPYLADERSARIEFLRQSLDDPELGIGEKYRRFAEGLNVDVEYGKNLEVGNHGGVLDGKRMDLILVRAGRVGYYCLTMDRTRAGIWDRERKEFASLPEDMLQTVKNLELVAQTQQYHTLVTLPLPVEVK